MDISTIYSRRRKNVTCTSSQLLKQHYAIIVSSLQLISPQIPSKSYLASLCTKQHEIRCYTNHSFQVRNYKNVLIHIKTTPNFSLLLKVVQPPPGPIYIETTLNSNTSFIHKPASNKPQIDHPIT